MSAQTPDPTALITFTDQVEQDHLDKMDSNLAVALKQPVQKGATQPVQNAFPLSPDVAKQVSNFEEENAREDRRVKIGRVFEQAIPAVRIGKAGDFLGKRLEWLSKKTGQTPGLKKAD
jgi:hypothetical protein